MSEIQVQEVDFPRSTSNPGAEPVDELLDHLIRVSKKTSSQGQESSTESLRPVAPPGFGYWPMSDFSQQPPPQPGGPFEDNLEFGFDFWERCMSSVPQEDGSEDWYEMTRFDSIPNDLDHCIGLTPEEEAAICALVPKLVRVSLSKPVRGVYLDRRRGLWRANWRDGGKVRTKGFRITQWGAQEARKKAIEVRKLMETRGCFLKLKAVALGNHQQRDMQECRAFDRLGFDIQDIEKIFTTQNQHVSNHQLGFGDGSQLFPVPNAIWNCAPSRGGRVPSAMDHVNPGLTGLGAEHKTTTGKCGLTPEANDEEFEFSPDDDCNTKDNSRSRGLILDPPCTTSDSLGTQADNPPETTKTTRNSRRCRSTSLISKSLSENGSQITDRANLQTKDRAKSQSIAVSPSSEKSRRKRSTGRILNPSIRRRRKS